MINLSLKKQTLVSACVWVSPVICSDVRAQLPSSGQRLQDLPSLCLPVISNVSITMSAGSGLLGRLCSCYKAGLVVTYRIFGHLLEHHKL